MTGKVQKKILVVLTNHATLASGKLTGYWLSELTHFFVVVQAAGFEMDFMSPLGGEPPMDPASHVLSDPVNAACLGDAAFMEKLRHTKLIEDVRAEHYVAIYYPGGHGPMWDLAQNTTIARIASDIYENGGVVSAACHGPAALLPIVLSDGTPLLAGKTVTGFSNLEERLSGKVKEVPFLLEDRLRAQTKKYTKAFFPFSQRVEVDGRLVTGQNPKSARGVAQAVVKLV